jgi:hypothetical protein
MRSGMSSSAGVTAIVVGVIGVSIIISAVTGQYAHWLPVTLGVLVGLWAVRVINQ